jgi:hypothetical protein
LAAAAMILMGLMVMAVWREILADVIVELHCQLLPE